MSDKKEELKKEEKQKEADIKERIANWDHEK